MTLAYNRLGVAKSNIGINLLITGFSRLKI